ncbi:acyltransferase-like protein At3g26840, chloroplastic [Chenopodium quinoa]|nr:acyltransferase-like protein At3g26840, chloroplastic [Chenopodium quinoa]
MYKDLESKDTHFELTTTLTSLLLSHHKSMSVSGVGYLAGAGLSSTPLTFFGTASSRRRPAAVVAVNLERKLNSWSASAATTTVTPMVGVAVNQDDNHINGKAVISGAIEVEQEVQRSWRDYFELAKLFIGSDGGGCRGPPRWFSPLEGGSRIDNSPLLLYLPGLDGLGCGLVLQQQKLGKIFDVWCLHIPVKDRTPFQELVMLVEETVRSEYGRSPGRPIYLVGESMGGCLALAVAARNPDTDLVLILANPATCYNKSHLQSLLPLLEVIPNELSLISLPYTLSLMTGGPFNLISSSVGKGIEQQATLEQLSQGLGELSSYFSVLADILPRDTLLWKLQMMKSACSYANSRLHAVKAQILILASGRDPLLPSLEEAERIRASLPKQEIYVLKNSGKMSKCEIRKFNDSGHFLFLEDGVDLVTIIKGTSLYRRGKFHDYVYDYLPPTKAEFKKTAESFRWLEIATGPVMLSTLENGDIVRGLAGIPSEGPVIYVGYHMILGLEIYPLVMNFMSKRNILMRGLAHPMIFAKVQEDALDLSMFDSYRIMGAVPVSASNFYKLLSSGSHILLYPGGMREALHKKGEGYQLFWPERSEFVRMAARFGAKIIPFGAVGEDDICEILLDSEDQMKIPYLRETIEKRTTQIQLRTDMEGEVANQPAYLPGLLPKLPGRFYFLFGKPIDTAGMKQELSDREKAHEVYLQAKSEVERCISYLKEKREKDPYRSLAARTLYHTIHGSADDAPTFEL